MENEMTNDAAVAPMTDIDVPDWVVEIYRRTYRENFIDGRLLKVDERINRALRAALSAWVVPAPALHISERCAACGDVLHASVSSDNHYTLRQEKPE